MQMISSRTKVLVVLLVTILTTAAAAAPPEMQLLERKDLPGGMVRERLRLPGFDPDEAVPAIAIHPAGSGPFPVAICFHCFRGAKENIESVRGFVQDLKPLYRDDPDRLRFLPFTEAGHGATEAMWQEAQAWIVRGLENTP